MLLIILFLVLVVVEFSFEVELFLLKVSFNWKCLGLLFVQRTPLMLVGALLLTWSMVVRLLWCPWVPLYESSLWLLKSFRK